MRETGIRGAFGHRSSVGRRLRILRHRTARWFLPPVRSLPSDEARRPAASRHVLPEFETPLWRH